MIPFSDLVSSVIQAESAGNPNAVNSRTGASGLMQVMKATAADPGFGVKPMAWADRFDPAANRRFGEDYLQAMLNRYDGDQQRALAAYNWGPGHADKWDGQMSSLPDETRGYISKIMQMNPGSTEKTAIAEEKPQGFFGMFGGQDLTDAEKEAQLERRTEVAGLFDAMMPPPQAAPILQQKDMRATPLQMSANPYMQYIQNLR